MRSISKPLYKIYIYLNEFILYLKLNEPGISENIFVKSHGYKIHFRVAVPRKYLGIVSMVI